MSRCHFHTYQDCSCRASGAPCRVEMPAIKILEEANNNTAGRDAIILIALAVFVSIVMAYSAHVGFDRQAKAYETARRV